MLLKIEIIFFLLWGFLHLIQAQFTACDGALTYLIVTSSDGSCTLTSKSECCVNQCSGGYYSNTNEMKCYSCIENCASCTTASDCSSCISGYFLMNDAACVYDCGDGYYSSSGKCISCEDNWNNDYCKGPNFSVELLPKKNRLQIYFTISSSSLNSDDELQIQCLPISTTAAGTVTTYPTPVCDASQYVCNFEEGVFENGISYEYSCSASDSDATNYKTIQFSGEEISNGQIQINPTSGVELDTFFSISGEDITNPANSFLLYSFYYWSSQSSSYVLLGSSTSSVLETTLPAGDKDSSYSLTIQLIITNYFGSSLQLQTEITVAKSEISNESTYLEDSLDSLESDSQKILFLASSSEALVEDGTNRDEVSTQDLCGGCSLQHGICNSQTLICECEPGYQVASDCSLPDEEAEAQQSVADAIITCKNQSTIFMTYLALGDISQSSSDIFETANGDILIETLKHTTNNDYLIDSSLISKSKNILKTYVASVKNNVLQTTSEVSKDSSQNSIQIINSLIKASNFEAKKANADKPSIFTETVELTEMIPTLTSNIMKGETSKKSISTSTFNLIAENKDSSDLASLSIEESSDYSIQFPTSLLTASGENPLSDTTSTTMEYIEWKFNPFPGHENSSIIASTLHLSLLTSDGSKIKISNLKEKFIIKMEFSGVAEDETPQCLYFDENTENYSIDGMTTISIEKNEADPTSGYIYCSSTHLTDFVTSKDELITITTGGNFQLLAKWDAIKDYDFVDSIIFWISAGISVVCITIIIIYLVIEKREMNKIIPDHIINHSVESFNSTNTKIVLPQAIKQMQNASHRLSKREHPQNHMVDSYSQNVTSFKQNLYPMKKIKAGLPSFIIRIREEKANKIELTAPPLSTNQDDPNDITVHSDFSMAEFNISDNSNEGQQKSDFVVNTDEQIIPKSVTLMEAKKRSKLSILGRTFSKLHSALNPFFNFQKGEFKSTKMMLFYLETTLALLISGIFFDPSSGESMEENLSLMGQIILALYVVLIGIPILLITKKLIEVQPKDKTILIKSLVSTRKYNDFDTKTRCEKIKYTIGIIFWVGSVGITTFWSNLLAAQFGNSLTMTWVETYTIAILEDLLVFQPIKCIIIFLIALHFLHSSKLETENDFDKSENSKVGKILLGFVAIMSMLGVF